MNKLILIGNGFDLAHGLQTSYADFMLWYLKKCLKKIEVGPHSDSLMDIDVRPAYGRLSYIKEITIDDLVDACYRNGQIQNLLYGSEISLGNSRVLLNIFAVRMKSKLVSNLFLKCSASTWVEIENEFYSQLKSILDNKTESRLKLLSELNNSMAAIIAELGLYLSELPDAPFLSGYEKILKSMFVPDKAKSAFEDGPERSGETPILNFNYTSTIDNYISKLRDEDKKNIEVNYIHGQINNSDNPIVFGFGDELDSDYMRMELEKTNAFFEYIKSFWYFKTSNYQNLIRFIESATFEVHVWGHSCGLSDRTLLNMILEHENCASIKIYYHGTKEKNNHKHLTQEIARHFRNKSAMRKRIVPLDQSSPMPQYSILDLV